MADDAPTPAVRASDAERETAIDRLRDAAGEGRLTFEELADRVESAATAVTRQELERLTADLPSGVAPGRSRELASPPARAASVFGDVRREGGWVVPARGTWRSLFGDIALDLREARVASPEVRIEAGTVFGDVELLVPEGVEVDVRSRTLFGDVRHDGGEITAPDAPRIVLTGGSVFGDIKVRARRLRERLAAG